MITYIATGAGFIIFRDQWVEDRMGDLLPTTYFHLVFTLPQDLRSLCIGNRKLLFGLLFKSAQHTILMLAKDKKYIGGTPGIVSILHTNGQDLSFHPCLCRQAGTRSQYSKWWRHGC